MSEANIYHGDCLEVLRSMPDGNVDAIVTDPPYGLSFMGKKWDYDVPSVEIWVECLRVLKSGGHLLAFAGTRTQHRMAVRIEDAGFEIRDMIAWVYGSGFPKSLDVSKAITATQTQGGSSMRDLRKTRLKEDYKPTCQVDPNGETFAKKKLGWTPDGDRVPTELSPAAQQWAGWGTALKPALEPITVARKPLVGTVAANVLEHGTGALNVDGCRVEAVEGRPLIISHGDGFGSGEHVTAYGNGLSGSRHGGTTTTGRWPATLIHDGSDEPCGLLQDAARFFYCAKASKADRDEGNNHPTVKPTDLMRYLCRLVTPPGGVVLDPFTGSGSTGKAAVLEGFRFIGIERDPQYIEIARARVAAVRREPEQVELI